MNKQVTRICIGAVVLIGILNSGVFASPIFTENFEGNLSLWTGKSGGAHHGLITTDPLNSGNNVLTFTATNSGGDIFTTAAFNLVAGQQYSVSFDYLGLPGQIPGGSGGFAGLAQDYPGTHLWYYGTNTTSGASPILVDDGQWHSYTYDFIASPQTGNSIHLMFEDYRYPGTNVAGDAFFDNVQISTVPVPGAMALGTIGISLAGYLRRRKGL